MNSEMNTQGYPATAPIPAPETCGRGCCDDWDFSCCCEPCDSWGVGNSIDQFNVCPMKITTLSFLMCDDDYLSGVNWGMPTELGVLLNNHFEGLLLTEAEESDLYNLMLEGGFGGQEDSDSDSDEEEEEQEVLTTCGRGCCGHWDVRCCCEPNCPQKNSMEQFNVCPMKLQTLAFHCGNEPDLSEHRSCDWHELRRLLMNFHDGLELSLGGEASELWDLIHEDDSDSDEEEEEEEEEPPPPPTDTRPLINQEWRKNNPERWKELNETPDHCPVCFESEDVKWHGYLNTGISTKCTHWFCLDCFRHIKWMDDLSKRKCPICKDSWR